MKTVWNVLKFVLIWLVLGAIIIFGIYLIFDNLLLGFKVFAIIFAVWLVLYIIYRIVKRVLAKRRVKQLVNIERGEESGEEAEESWFPLREFLTEDRTLYRRIGKLLRYLRTSRLNILTDSVVYAKPWILFIGEEGSHTTSLIENSNVRFPITGAESLKAPDGMIDFYLANEAVYINLSHELFPGHGSKIPAQLVQLLKALVYNRLKEPVNSIVLTLDAEELLKGGSEEIKKMAEKHRFYLNFFMLYLRMPVPIHLTINNTHKLYGFREWTSLLSDEQLHEPLGEVNMDNDDAEDFLDRAVVATRRHVERLVSLAFSAGKKVPPPALGFSNSLSSLEVTIKEYVEIMFVDNEYQESPVLAGLFFMGSRVVGDVTPEEEAADPTLPRVSYFSQSVITRVLPNDREHIHDLEQVRKRKVSMPAVYFLGAWVGGSLAFVAAIWFFSISSAGNISDYYDDYKTRIAAAQILNFDPGESSRAPAPTTDTDDLIRRSQTINYLERLVKATQGKEESWWLPWRYFIGQGDFTQILRSGFYNYMRSNVTLVLDAALEQHFKQDFSASKKLRLSQRELDAQIADYASLLYQRIFVLDQYLQKMPMDSLQDLGDPFSNSPLYFRDAIGVTDQDVGMVNNAYIQSLYWSELEDGSPNPAVNGEINTLNRLLARVLNQGSNNLSWIVGWANQTLRLEEVNIEDQFLGAANVEPPLIVGAAYTNTGDQLIDDFVFRMLALYEPGDPVYNRLVEFRKTYIQNYLSSWSHFSENATRGLERLTTRPEWYATIQQLSGEKNPFFTIIDLMNVQTGVFLKGGLLPSSRDRLEIDKIKAVAEGRGQKLGKSEINRRLEEATSEPEVEAPEWVRLLDFYEQMKKVGQESVSGGANPALQKVVTKFAIKALGKAGKVGKTLSKTAKKTSKSIKKANKGKRSTARTVDELQQNLEKSAAQLDTYIIAMRDLSLQAESRSSLYSEIKGMFQNSQDISKAQGSLGKMHDALKNLQFSMGIESNLNRPFWALLRGSVYTIERFAVQESAEELQSRWEKQVLAQATGLEGEKFAQTMFGENSGLLWKFFADEIEPFFDTTVVGTLVPKFVDRDIQLPFRDEFVKYATKAKLGLSDNRPSYSVVLEGGPISVNPESLFKPVRTILSMSCGEKDYNLVNLNFKTRDIIEWTPKCGDLTLTIDFSVFSAKKVFRAPKGFAEFLKSFDGGLVNMKVSEFPEQATSLRDINVSSITLRYKATGAEELVASLDAFPKENPQRIVVSWSDLLRNDVDELRFDAIRVASKKVED